MLLIWIDTQLKNSLQLILCQFRVFLITHFKLSWNSCVLMTLPVELSLIAFFRRENQGRGIQHWHTLIWVRDAPTLGRSPNEEVAAFISKYLTSKIPDKSTCPILYNHLVSYQKHRHNNYCL